jgi:hypothetical protein
MADNPLINITIRGAGAGAAIIGGGIYAALITPPNATTWIASAGPDGTIAFTDQASGPSQRDFALGPRSRRRDRRQVGGSTDTAADN